MSIPKYFSVIKAPGDNLPYGFNFKDWFTQNAQDLPSLANDTISTATISASPAGLTIGTVTVDSTGMIASAMISSGTDGTDYTLSCQILSHAGLTAVAQQIVQCRAAAR